MNTFTFENYPDIRDLTRKLSKDIQARLGDHLETVKTHFRPGPIFGHHLSSGSKSAQENPRTASAAFAQFSALFKQIAPTPPLNLEPQLPEAIDITFATPVLCPYVYPHDVATPAETRRLTITAPFRFVLAFPEYSFSDLRSAVRGPKDKLREFVLHYAVLNYVVMQNKRLLTLFADLRFPISSERFDEFGPLPITMITAPAGSVRPPDAFIAQVRKFAGIDAAEELVDLDAWNNLSDPLTTWFREEAVKFPAAVLAS